MQGEGPQVGYPTLFVRFAECDLRCRWCDTPESWRRVDRCRVEWIPGQGEFGEIPNPVGLDVIDQVLERMALPEGHWVSLTGGEPLLQAEAVLALAKHLTARGMRPHLETHGLAVDALRSVVDHLSFVSMDWKLASDVRRVSDRGPSPVADYHDAHACFLEIVRAHTEGCVKVVLTPNSEAHEISTMCERIAQVDPNTPLILQPVTPHGGTKAALSASDLMAHLRLCRDRLRDVRLIPQTHKIYGVL